MTRLRAAAVLAALLLLAEGCGSNAQPAGQPSASPRTLTVFAAASLKAPFTTMGQQFEAANAGTEVTFNFAGSSDLVTQLQSGARADVFASADSKNMDKGRADNLVAGAPIDFASNALQIAVPPDNPAKIQTFADLAKPGVNLVVCAPVVPCGAAADKVELASGVRLDPVSEESSVTDVVNKVTSGEADAGLVYVTDVRAAGDQVRGVSFPESKVAVNVYPIATLADTRSPELATAFIELVTGPQGQQILAEAGFAKP
jgi:molybdate transport system substrate-binding protein